MQGNDVRSFRRLPGERVDQMKILQRKIGGSRDAILNCGYSPPDTEKRTILIALPFGVPLSVADAAFAKLAPAFNVVTWESRYILNLEQSFSGTEKVGPGEHVEDMICILRALGIQTCLLIGYCSGAGISLLAARQHPDVFTELILVNGEYQLFRRGHTSTDYQRSIDTFLPAVAASREQATFIFSKMDEISKVSKGGDESELEKLINLPFSKEEHLYRYAKNYMAYREFDALEIAAGVLQETYVLTGRRDEHSSMENSEAVDERLPISRKFVDGEGDHYEFCRPGSMILEEIDTYLSARVS